MPYVQTVKNKQKRYTEIPNLTLDINDLLQKRHEESVSPKLKKHASDPHI